MSKSKKQLIGTVDVLGTPYKIYKASETDPSMRTGICGYVKPYEKEIYLHPDNIEDVDGHIGTHELVHAFLFESGLHMECEWADDEEMVDWIALQAGKIVKAALQLKICNNEFHKKKKEISEDEDN